MINLFLILIIIVLIIDISGIINSLKFGISKIFRIKNYNRLNIKPLDCSFCMNFWCSLIYLYMISNISIFNIAYILLLSFMTEPTKDVLYLIKDIFSKIINKIYDIFNL